MDGTKSGQEDRSITPPQFVGAISTINQAVNEMLADLELSPLTKQTYRHGLNATMLATSRPALSAASTRIPYLP